MAEPTQGNDPPQGSQGNGAPGSISLEDVNKAITARFSAYEKKLDTKFTESFGGFETKLTELLGQKLEELKPKAPDGDNKPAQTSSNIEEHPQFRGLQKQLSEVKNKLEAQQKAAEAERAKARDVTLRQRVTERLVEGGIDGTRAKHALGYLVDAEKRVRFADDKADSIVFADANGEALDLETGLKGWLSSDEAKLYLPPRGAAGSGERTDTTNRRSGAPSDSSDESAKKTILAYFGQR
jgi:hypothetical protein